MDISPNEVRARAAAFAKEWQDARYEKEDTQSFYNEFFEVFDVRRRSVARYAAHVQQLDNRHGYGFIAPQDGSKDVFCESTRILSIRTHFLRIRTRTEILSTPLTRELAWLPPRKGRRRPKAFRRHRALRGAGFPAPG